MSHHTRLRELFIAACDLPASEQSALLEDQCADDPDLRSQLEAMLRKDSSERGLLADDDLAFGIRIHAQDSGPPDMPHQIGRYRIQRLLGAGGMGVVWLATQENPQRDVAVKVVRPGLMSRELQRRFELEAALLGRLRHPGIAQIYEAGVFDDGAGGRPFFAMEFIDGLPLLQYLKSVKLDVRGRLELFASICDAVHHAHQKGIVHRDLKPANILVVDERSHGSSAPVNGQISLQPKVLDFGVARALDSDLQATTVHQGVVQLVGTLQYMSPEQVEANPQSVDTRSDVYALGVILYQMLTDRLPYDLTDCTIASAARRIAEVEASPLTTADRAFRGDLNTIVLKALEKNPAARYQSASDLAADVRRHLHHQPIAARPATTLYQFQKFATRNKALVGGVATVFIVLVAGVIGTSRGLLQAQAERDQAQRQTRIAQAVNDFLNVDLLSKTNPYIRPGREVLLRDVLDEAAETVATRFADEPEVEAAVRRMLGETYQGLGEYDRALVHLQRAVTLFTQLDGVPDSDSSESEAHFDNLIKARLALVSNILVQWRLDEAETLARETIQLLEQRGGPLDLRLADARQQLGVVLKRRGDYEQAEAQYRQAVEINNTVSVRRALTRAQRRAVIIASNNLAVLLNERQRFDEAEPLFRKVVADWEQLQGRRHADTAYGLNNLGDCLWRQERLDEAELVWGEALDIRNQVLGADHPDTLFSLYSIGLIESDTGRLEPAEHKFRTVLAAREQFLEPANRDVLNAINSIGVTLEKQQRYDEAVTMFRDALERAYSVFDPDHRSPRLYRGNLLKSLQALGADEPVADVHRDYFNRLANSLESNSLQGIDWAKRANALAWRLLTCEASAARDPATALKWAQRANDAVPDNPQFLDTLSLALAENGRLEEAVSTQRRALELLPPEASKEVRQSITEALEKFLLRLDAQRDAGE